MLTDIFANRYTIKIWDEFGKAEERLLVQLFQLLEEICPYCYTFGLRERDKQFWVDIHNTLSRELGLKSLPDLAYSYTQTYMGNQHDVSGTWPLNTVCENWMNKLFDPSQSADLFIKQRISLVEIGFRKRSEEISGKNESNESFERAVHELNERFKQARCLLHYHNGFIQKVSDELTLRQIEEPFWSLVAESKWENVDHDMKEALNLRDSGIGDPSIYAMRALESTIKIVSDDKHLTNNQERSVHNYIDKLAANSVNFLVKWESNNLKELFKEIRNPHSHGAGNSQIPNLTQQQTDWVIEICMIWIKSIIRRL